MGRGARAAEPDHLADQLQDFYLERIPSETPLGQIGTTQDGTDSREVVFIPLGDRPGLATSLNSIRKEILASRGLIEILPGEESLIPTMEEAQKFLMDGQVYVWDMQTKKYYHHGLPNPGFIDKSSPENPRVSKYVEHARCIHRKDLRIGRIKCLSGEGCQYKVRQAIGQGNYGEDFYCAP